MPHLNTIAVASEATGLDPKEIEYAEQIGLLSAGREAEGMLSPTQMRTLHGIARLVHLGLSLDDISDLGLSENVLSEIRDYLGSETTVRPPVDVSRRCLSATIHILESHEHALAEQIGQLDRLRLSLADRIGAFHRLLDALDEQVRQAA